MKLVIRSQLDPTRLIESEYTLFALGPNRIAL
jgi:hypothetical protein